MKNSAPMRCHGLMRIGLCDIIFGIWRLGTGRLNMVVGWGLKDMRKRILCRIIKFSRASVPSRLLKLVSFVTGFLTCVLRPMD